MKSLLSALELSASKLTPPTFKVILCLLSSLSQADPSGYLKAIETIRLDNIQHLIQLLRLVQAKQVDQDMISSN